VGDALWVDIGGNVVPGELGAALFHSHLEAILVDGDDVFLDQGAEDSARDLHVDAFVVAEVLDDAEVVAVALGVLEQEGEDLGFELGQCGVLIFHTLSIKHLGRNLNTIAAYKVLNGLEESRCFDCVSVFGTNEAIDYPIILVVHISVNGCSEVRYVLDYIGHVLKFLFSGSCDFHIR